MTIIVTRIIVCRVTLVSVRVVCLAGLYGSVGYDGDVGSCGGAVCVVRGGSGETFDGVAYSIIRCVRRVVE